MPFDLRQLSTIIVSNKHNVHKKSPENGNNYFEHIKKNGNEKAHCTVQCLDNEQTAILKIPIESTFAKENG